MPLGWVFNSFQFLLVDLGVSVQGIGVLSMVSLPWSIKLLWAPLVDRFAPTAWFGPRRNVMLAAQLLLAGSFFALAYVTRQGYPLPQMLLLLAGLAFGVALFSATFDIAYDANVVETLLPDERAAAPGLRSAYYFGGMLLAGAFATSLSGTLGWPTVHLLIGAAFLAMVPMTLLFSRPGEGPPRQQRTLREAVVEPFLNFIRRPEALSLAGFLILYKFGDNVAGTVINPFLRALCFTNVEAGLAVKSLGLVATIIGGLLGGIVVIRLGLWRALWVLGIAQALANLLYALTAAMSTGPLIASQCGSVEPLVRGLAYASIAVEYGCKAMAGSAQGALLLKVCDRDNAVTQFALLTSLFALGRWVSGPPAGFLAAALGYPWFFTGCATLLAIPGLLYLYRLGPYLASSSRQ